MEKIMLPLGRRLKELRKERKLPPPAGREEQGKAGELILAGVCLILCRMNIQAISQSNLDPSVICLRIQALPKEKPKCTVIFLSRAPG